MKQKESIVSRSVSLSGTLVILSIGLTGCPNENSQGISNAQALLNVLAVDMEYGNFERRADVDAEVSSFMKSQKVPGCSLSIGRQGEIAYAMGYGYSEAPDWETENPGVPMTVGTVLGIGSISKTITAVAAMKLVEENKLDLKRPIVDYVPEFLTNGRKITSEKLLAHQAGLENGIGDNAVGTAPYDLNGDNTYFNDAVNAVTGFNQMPLLYEPGTNYYYTNYGYALLGAVIQRAAGQNYEDYVREKVAAPAGLSTLFVDYAPRFVPSKSKMYTTESGQAEELDSAGHDWHLAAGGFAMTSVDLVKFAQALLEERILYRRYLDLMWTKQRLNNGNQTIHTLGFFTKYISQIDREVILHRGLVNGFYGSLVIDPESEVVIGLLCNSREENQVGVTTRLLDTAVSRWEPIMHVLKKKKKTFPSAIPVEPLKPTTRKPRKREISQANVTPNPVKFEGLGLR